MAEVREIDLIDLLAEVLKHWKGAVISLLIGALCLGAFSYFRSGGEASLPEDEKSLSAEERHAIDTALLYDELYVFAKGHEDESVIMKFDSANVPSVKLTFAVEAEEDNANEIAQAYQAAFSSRTLAEKIIRDTDIKDDLSELITFSIPETYSEKGTRYFSVECAYPEEEKCEEICAVIQAYLFEKSSGMQDTVGEHTLRMVSSDVTCSQDWTYQTKQQQLKEKTLNQRNSLVNAVGKLTDDQKAFFIENSLSELWKEADEEAASVAEAEGVAENNAAEQHPTVKKHVSKKWTVLGAVLFCFMYFAFWGVKYLLDGHLKSSDDMLLLINVPQLGRICTEIEPTNIIDKGIFRLKHHGQRLFAPEKSVELLATNLSVNARKKDVSSITIVGCDLESKAKDYCKKLAELLKGTYQIEANILDDIVYNQKAVESLAESKSVVFVETAGNTLYSDLEKEVLLINRLDIPVLGGVLVE